MSRIRITVRGTGDRTEDLQRASRVRQDLWAHSPVEIDPDSPLHGTHRDEAGRAYFEVATSFPDQVRRVLREYHHEEQVELTEHPGPLGQECINCGNVAGRLAPPRCTNCGFLDISNCPVCDHSVSRQEYEQIVGDLFRCPRCQSRVRLRFNEPMFNRDGTFRQPLVVVERV